MGKENLIPFTERTESEVREMNAKGGRKSGETRRKQKTLRETLNIMLEKCATDPKYREMVLEAGIKKNGITNKDIVVAAMVLKAAAGDTKAFELIRDTIGEKPAEEINLNNIEIEINED